MSLGKCTLKQPWDTTIYLLEWLKSKILTIPNAGEDVKLSFNTGGNEKQYSHCGRQFGSFLWNLTYSYHTVKQSCSLVFIQRYWNLMTTKKKKKKKTCTQTLIAAFSIIATTWKQPNCPSTGDWYTKTMDYSEVKKKCAIKPWRNLRGTLWRTLKRPYTYMWFQTHDIQEKGKLWRQWTD